MDTVVFEQFEDTVQQQETYHVGVWVFLASEVMFFGGMIAGYIAYRFLYPNAFMAGCQLMDLTAGTVNTVVLLTSSLFMALAVHEQQKKGPHVSRWLTITLCLGIVFLFIKFYEYYEHIEAGLLPGPHFHMAHQSQPAQLYFLFYFTMTGFHALHLSIGCALVAGMAWLSRRPLATFPSIGLEMVGLYWHFVDIVWIFLYPMLYLIGHHQGG